MNADERFDQQLRAALEWQADEAARRVPSLERSVARLADRLGPEPARPPVIGIRSGSGRGVQLVFAVILLAILLAAALAIGSLLQTRPTIEPPRFGFAGACFGDRLDGAVASISEDDSSIVIYEDGRHTTFLGTTGATRSEIFETGGIERRLTERGIELILARVAETLPEPGCRHLRSETATGQIAVFTPDGLIELSWHPSNNGRRLTADEEADAEALQLALTEPEAWLPNEGLVERTPRRETSERWLVFVELMPSGFGPGEEVTTSTGDVLRGSDPRYARVVLPGGQQPAEFGEEVAVRDGASVRCGVLGTEDARRLSDSLDALPLAMHDEEELFTEDLTSRVFIYIATSYPAEPDCAAAGEGQVPPEPTPEPAPPTPDPAHDLAGVDPCDLIPASVDALFGDDVRRESHPSSLPLGTPARACTLLTGAEFAPSTSHLVVTLYPQSVDAEAADVLAMAIMGGGSVEETIAGRPAWVNDCWAAAGLSCRGAIAFWSGRYLLVAEFPGQFPGEASTTTPETGRSIVGAIVEGLPE